MSGKTGSINICAKFTKAGKEEKSYNIQVWAGQIGSKKWQSISKRLGVLMAHLASKQLPFGVTSGGMDWNLKLRVDLDQLKNKKSSYTDIKRVILGLFTPPPLPQNISEDKL